MDEESSMPRADSVSIAAGAIAFARAPNGPTARASVFVSAMSPPFDAV